MGKKKKEPSVRDLFLDTLTKTVFRVHRYIEIEDEKLMNEGKSEYLS